MSKKLTAKEVAIIVASEMKEERLRASIATLRRKNKELMALLGRIEEENEAILELKKAKAVYKIVEQKSFSKSVATAFMVASDWHLEEKVLRSVLGYNEYNLEIARRRGVHFFSKGLKLIKKEQQDVEIKNLILPLLGDFITNQLHDEMPENNQLLPIEAIMVVQEIIESGIRYLLQNSKLNITCVCHSGNHGRITRTTRYASERGHSLEYFMYHSLKNRFKSKRIKFIVADGYQTMLDVYGRKIRIHHGHQIKGGGGIGGITVPINRWIAKRNTTERADLDVFGHFHQYIDGGNFIVNGSMIGFNAFAQSINAVAEPPKQAFFLIDKKRGKTIAAPILFED